MTQIALDPVTIRTDKELSEAAQKLGNAGFKNDYGLKYAYLAGAMYRGLASKEMVISMGKAGMMGFLGTGGMSLEEIEADIDAIESQLSAAQPWGLNLIANATEPQKEMQTIELYLKKHVSVIEASAFMQITPALVYYRLQGLQQEADGSISCKNKVIGKLSHVEVARGFMSSPPQRLVDKLLADKKITNEQAEWSQSILMADDICVEADSGGHTDQGVAMVLLPAIQSLRQQLGIKPEKLRIGLAGGIGTPQSVAVAFSMNADFILTGSINQCTVESGANDVVKDLLQEININDTAYAPAGDMFEFGAKVQVLKKGLFFPARANRLFALYSQYNSLDEIPENVLKQLEEKYFGQTIEQIWQSLVERLEQKNNHKEIARAQKNPKHKMALVFRWYFGYSARLAFAGDTNNLVNFQVHTGPALGAFNQWVKGTELQDWRNRHVDQIGITLMEQGASVLISKLNEIFSSN